MGEIEAFDKSVGVHGPKWVNKVLEKTFKMIQHCHRLRNLLQRYYFQKQIDPSINTGGKFSLL
jgi:hypothetical protein